MDDPLLQADQDRSILEVSWNWKEGIGWLDGGTFYLLIANFLAT